MKKRTAWIVGFVALLTLLTYSHFARGASMQIVVERSMESDTPEEKTKPALNFSNITRISNDLAAPNEISLINKSTISNMVKIDTERNFKRLGKMKFEFTNTLSTPNDLNVSDSYGILEIASTKKFRNFDVALNTNYYHSRYNSFGIAGIRFSKPWLKGDSKSNDPQPKHEVFLDGSYYIKTERNPNFHSALVLRSGVASEFQYKRVRFETLLQAIKDYGAIRYGNRFAINADIVCYLPVSKNLYIGPRFGYTRFLDYNRQDETLKSNNPSWAIDFAYFR